MENAVEAKQRTQRLARKCVLMVNCNGLYEESWCAALTQLNKTNLNPINEQAQNPQKLQFRSYGFQCRALQEENQLVIRCLDDQNNSREAILPRRDVKQLLPVADSDEMTILLRTPRAVELWKWSNDNYSLSSKLMDGQVEQMALSQGGAGMESEYVALMALSPAAEIRIYSFSSPDTISFQLDQVLELQDSQQLRVMRFMHLPESDDLLLCVSNVLPQQQLRIYQHSGAAGFQPILGDSALPKAHALEVLQLPSYKLQLLSIATEEAVYLLQPQFTTL
ncbi:GM20593 [Drosophila sechellia]|uniref:GM20593 n=1 Tax=Drosophila sechellia TaxID=7238 RepID=B4HT14_DROSE|nr:GM20593 [Drosophila sechellia]